MECSLDNASTYCKELSTVDQVYASQNATEGVNVSAFVSPVQHCVVADVRLRYLETPCA